MTNSDLNKLNAKIDKLRDQLKDLYAQKTALRQASKRTSATSKREKYFRYAQLGWSIRKIAAAHSVNRASVAKTILDQITELAKQIIGPYPHGDPRQAVLVWYLRRDIEIAKIIAELPPSAEMAPHNFMMSAQTLGLGDLSSRAVRFLASSQMPDFPADWETADWKAYARSFTRDELTGLDGLGRKTSYEIINWANEP